MQCLHVTNFCHYEIIHSLLLFFHFSSFLFPLHHIGSLWQDHPVWRLYIRVIYIKRCMDLYRSGSKFCWLNTKITKHFFLGAFLNRIAKPCKLNQKRGIVIQNIFLFYFSFMQFLLLQQHFWSLISNFLWQ